MNTKLNYLIFLLTAGVLWSCGPTKTQEIVFESADKSNLIKVSGKRTTSLDPFQANIVISGFEQSDTLVTEIYAKDLTKENVLIVWPDNNSCALTFVQQDDSKRTLNIRFSQEGNSLNEVPQ